MARRGYINASVGETGDRTMLLYTTLMLILVSFFVVLLSKANFDETKYSTVVSSIKLSFGTFTGGRSPIGDEEGLPDLSRGVDESGRLLIQDLEMAQVRALLAPAIMSREARIIHSRDKRIVSMSAGLLFALDSSEINESMLATLKAFAGIVADSPVDIAIEGHTNNLPPQTSGVGDNWDISSRRALAVMSVLVDQGLDPARLSAFGYAGSRPLQSNLTPSGRARNNRVDLVMDFSRVKGLKVLEGQRESFHFRGFDFNLGNRAEP